MKQAYIVAGYRTAVGKAPRGSLRFTRPDEMATIVIKRLLQDFPNLDHERIDDLIVGNAMPEGEQGMNIARLVSLMALGTDKVSGVTINRFCASGSETIATAIAKIQFGMADCIIAGGTESMSFVPMGGFKPSPDTKLSETNPNYYWGMGYTAEQVAMEYHISREEQDQFAFESHQKALRANKEGYFQSQIVPVPVEYTYEGSNHEPVTKKFDFKVDEGPRADTSLEILAKLKPVFKNGGTVTAGNSSQMSDGAAFLMIMSEDMIKETGATPIARLVGYSTAGVPPRIMGTGPIAAVPKVLKQTGMKLDDIDLIELNEAFASQSVAVVKTLGFDKEKLNVNGGAIALGHPLGCTGSKLTVQILNELKRRDKKYGLVTMCVGSGQGAATILERL